MPCLVYCYHSNPFVLFLFFHAKPFFQKTQFILVPGPTDLCKATADLMPRPPLLDLLTQNLVERVNHHRRNKYD